MRITVLAFVIIITSFIASTAQILADTVTVNAMNIPLKINETGRSITVLGTEEIEMLSANSIDELLQTLTGVEIQSRGGFGVQGDILMRGSTFTQVLVLIDGMKMNDPLTGHYNSNIPVAIPEIAKIEVLRGAASAVYGPDAVGGVINIITKTFSKNNEHKGGQAEINYGQHNLIDGRAGIYQQINKWKIGAGISVLQSDGEEIPETVIDTNTTLEAYSTRFDIKTFGGSIGYDINKNTTLNFRSSFDYRDFDARYFYTTSTFDKSTEKVNNYWNRLQLVHVNDNGSTDFNFAHKYATDEFIFSPDFPSTNNHTTQYFNGTINHLQRINDNFSLKGGIQIDQRKIESNDRGNHSDMHYGIYGMGVYQSDKLNLIGNIRADQDANYGFQLLPSINASYQISSAVLRASIGKSIRAADYTERFVSNNLVNLTSGRSLGNPDLQSEMSWSEELGVDIQFSSSFQLSATAFARQSDNLIDYVRTNQSEIGNISEIGSLVEGADYFFAKNITEVQSQGIEIEGIYRLQLGNNNILNITSGYSYYNTSNEEDVISVYISSHANHLWTNRFSFVHNKFEIGLEGLYKQRNPRAAEAIGVSLDENYMIWNGVAKYRVTEKAYINFEARNIFDKEYQNILGARMPSRWIKAGVGFQF